MENEGWRRAAPACVGWGGRINGKWARGARWSTRLHELCAVMTYTGHQMRDGRAAVRATCARGGGESSSLGARRCQQHTGQKRGDSRKRLRPRRSH